jgi:hypothetical protein
MIWVLLRQKQMDGKLGMALSFSPGDLPASSHFLVHYFTLAS